jgi:hypothetical protein
MDVKEVTHRCHKKDSHYNWVESAPQTDHRDNENQWIQSIAVDSKAFIEKMKEALGYREIICADDAYELREVITPFGKAFYRLGDLGRAILFYERARLLLPRDDDLLFNLSHARNKTWMRSTIFGMHR